MDNDNTVNSIILSCSALQSIIQAAMDDPRPSLPAKEVFDRLRSLHEAQCKLRG